MQEGRSSELTWPAAQSDGERADGLDVDRWFGMYRSVRVEPIADELFADVQRQRRKHVRDMVVVVALILAGMAAITSWHGPDAGGFGELLMVMVKNCWWCFAMSLWPSASLTWRLFRIRAETPVEVFEGRAPRVQGYRDKLTETLVRDGLVEAARTHRLTVDPVTDTLLAVDGVPVKARAGRTVCTAKLATREAETSQQNVGSHRPLTPVEVLELDGVTAWHTRRSRLMAGSFVTLGVLAGACLLKDGSAWTVGTWSNVSAALAFTGGLAVWLLASRERSWRHQVAVVLSQGVLLGATTERLEALNLVWAREGLPSFERLERGRLAVGSGRVRPTTF